MDPYPLRKIDPSIDTETVLKFAPYFHNKQKNHLFIPIKDEGYGINPDAYIITYHPNDHPHIFIAPADKPINSPDIFDDKPYTYDELVQEFVDKFGAYLPDNFDWDSHIGIIDTVI